MAIERWTNWVGNRSCECDVLEPESLEKLQKMVKERAQHGRIRAAGNSYSWADLIPNQDTIIKMGRLNKILELNAKEKWVEVEAGVTIAQLTAVCAQPAFNLALISPTLFPQPQVGGAINTGSHGTGFGVSTFADSILEMTWVKHDGTTEIVRRGDSDYDAAKVTLGTFGILYSVKLELTENYAVYTDKVLVPVDQVLEGFPDLLQSCQFLEMFLFPLQSHFWIYMMDKTDSWPDKKTWLGELREKLNTTIQNVGGTYVVPWISRNAPGLTPMMNKAAIRFSDQVGASVALASDAFHFQHAYPKNWDCSYSIPAEHAARAWHDAIELVESYGAQGLYPVNLALHCRFTGASGTWLAADHGRETLFIECATAYGTPHWEEFYAQLQDRWFAYPMARPHWAKVYDTGAEIYGRYEKMTDFLAVRKRWDRDGVFLNSFLEDTVFHLNEPPGVRGAAARQKAQPAVGPAPA